MSDPVLLPIDIKIHGCTLYVAVDSRLDLQQQSYKRTVVQKIISHLLEPQLLEEHDEPATQHPGN